MWITTADSLERQASISPLQVVGYRILIRPFEVGQLKAISWFNFSKEIRMSNQLPNSFIAQFDSEVKLEYQKGSLLRDTVRLRTNVTGSTYRFPKMGRGMAQDRVFQADVTPMNVGHSGAVVNLRSKVAPEYTDIFAQKQVNFDEKRELVKIVAYAIGRSEDQMVIDDALVASNGATVALGVGGNNGLNVGKLRAMKQALDDKGVPQTDRHMAISAAALQQLLGDEKATSGDYNTIRALVNGEIDTFVNFKFHMIETRAEGGLPLVGTTRTIFAWHKDSVGLAEGMPESTEINYIPEKTSWLVTGKLLAGAINIDDNGIVKASIDDTLVV